MGAGGRARALTIAGSDSGGGAGIQADLKTFTVLGVYGASAITSVTAQNSQGVTGIEDLPAAFVARQIDAVLGDIGADAVKTGMLSNAGIVEAVSERLKAHGAGHLVVDPVMVATSGDRLLQEDAVRVIIDRLLPLAALVTPNLAEAEVLSGLAIRSEADTREAGRRIHGMGPKYVLIKGGHGETPDATDFLYDGQSWGVYTGPRIETRHTHGTGCTLSAAITAHLALGAPMEEAVERGKAFVTEALRHGFGLGQGRGPVNHLWGLDGGR